MTTWIVAPVLGFLVLLTFLVAIVTYVVGGPKLRRGLRIAGAWTFGLFVIAAALGNARLFTASESWPESGSLEVDVHYGGRRSPSNSVDISYGRRPKDMSVPAALPEDPAPDNAAVSSPPVEVTAEEPTPPPADQPAWVTNPPASTAKVHRELIEVGPFATDKECRTAMDVRLELASAEYLDSWVEHGNSQLLSISPTFMRKHVVTDQYMRTETRSFGPLADDQTMYTLYHLLEFDQAVNDRLAAMTREKVMQSRLAYAGFGLGSLMALLTAAFGYLRLDALTDGKYKRRLQWSAGGVVAAVAAGGWLLSQLVVLG